MENGLQSFTSIVVMLALVSWLVLAIGALLRKIRCVMKITEPRDPRPFEGKPR